MFVTFRRFRALESRFAEAQAKLADASRLTADLQEHLKQTQAALERNERIYKERAAQDGAEINRLERTLANAEARVLDAQRLIDRYVATIQRLELHTNSTGGLHASELQGMDETPNSPLEDVLDNYGLKDLARSVKSRRLYLHKRADARSGDRQA